MPYRHIIFLKLHKRLLNDPRWFTMSPISQLLFIKILLGLAHFDNRLTRYDTVLTQVLRIDLSPSDIKKHIKEIRKNFPKLKSNKHFYYYDGFDEYTNWVLPRNSQGTPKELVDKEKEEDKDKDKEKSSTHLIPLKENPLSFMEKLKENPAYKSIDMQKEYGKMQAWLLLPKNKSRKITPRFILNWLNKVEQPFGGSYESASDRIRRNAEAPKQHREGVLSNP